MNTSSNKSTRGYGVALLVIASLMIAVTVFGEMDARPGIAIGVAVLCAVAGYGTLRNWLWAKWLALAWGPIAVIAGVVVYQIMGRPISVPEYALGILFAAAWVWDANRRLRSRNKLDE